MNWKIYPLLTNEQMKIDALARLALRSALRSLRILLVLTFLGSVWSATATQYITANSGHWSHPGTWMNGLSPTNTVGLHDTVIIEHDVFFNMGGNLTVYGLLEVRGDLNLRTVLTLQSGKSLYIEGPAANVRLINAGFNNTGAPPSGNASWYNTNGNLYAFNSFIELARYMVNSGANSEYRNTCVSMGRDFTSTNSVENINNSTISLGLNTKGGFSFTGGTMSCKNAKMEVLSKSDGFFKLNSGSVSGNFTAISIQTKNGNLIANSQVSGKLTIENYCLNGGNILNGGAFTIIPGANDCNETSAYFPCSSFTPGFSFTDGYVVLPQDGSADIGILSYLFDQGYILEPGNINTTEVIDPAHGSLVYDVVTTSFTYTPDSGFSGVDSFTYVICDDLPFYDICDTAVVHLIVSPLSNQEVPYQPDTVLHEYAFDGSAGSSWPDAISGGWSGFQAEQVNDPDPALAPINDFLGLKYSEYNTLGSWIESPPIDFGGLKSLNISFTADGSGQITIFLRDSLNSYQIGHEELPDQMGSGSGIYFDISINNPYEFDPDFNSEIKGKMTLLIEYTNEDGGAYGRIYDFRFEGEEGTIWLGDHSQDWFHDPDWTNGVPHRKKSGLVPARRPNYPRIVGDAEAKALIVEKGAYIVVKPQGTLTTFDTTYMFGKYAMCLYSDSTGTGAFLPKAGFRGSATAYIEQWLDADMWHHVAAPIDSGMSGSYLSIYLLPWEESLNNWGDYIVPLDVPLPPMKGFAAWSSSVWPPMGDTLVWFGGRMNFDSYTTEVTNSGHSGNPAFDGWNLVGNPYTCSIHWDSLGWNKSSVEGAIYIWDPYAQSYRTYLGNGIGIPAGTTGEIPQGQGFFVKAKTGTGSFGVSPRARMLPTIDFYKSSGYVSSFTDKSLYITVDGQGLTDQVLVRWEEGATNGFDGDFDAYKLFGTNASAPQLYVMGAGTTAVPLAINTVGISDTLIIIPLGLKPGAGGNYVLSFSDLESFHPNTRFFLEDLKLDTVISISGTYTYSFYATGSDAEARFRLVIVPASVKGRVAYAGNPSLTFPGAEVVVKDDSGKWLKSVVSNGGGEYLLIGMNNGSYVLEADSVNQSWNGGNATDALNVCRSFLGLHTLSELSTKAADADNSGYVNTADALMISRRFVGLIQSFPGGDWVTETRGVQVNGAGTYTADVNVMCIGDVDGSYGASSSKVGFIPLSSEFRTMKDLLGRNGLPLYAASKAELGAISLSLVLPEGLQVEGVSVAAGHGELVYHQQGNTLLISWFSLQPFPLVEGREVFRIRFVNTVDLTKGISIRVAEPSEVADATGKVIDGFNLLIPSLAEQSEATMNVYPNPSIGNITCNIEGYTSADAVFEVLDATGRLIERWASPVEDGMARIDKDLTHLNAGKYVLRVSDPYGIVKEKQLVVIIAR